MRLGLVIVHFGSVAPTLRCVASIEQDPSSCPRDIVIVDNQGDVQRAALPAHIRLLEAADNPGYGAGANRGVAELQAAGVSADAWVVLNNDVEISPGFLDAASEAMLDRRVGAAGGPIRIDDSDGTLWYAGGWVRWWSGTVRQSREPDAASQRRPVGFIPGTAIVINANAFDAIGGFDPTFFLYHEDLDLCLRLQRNGWELRFEPGMAVVHHMGASTGSRQRSPLYLEAMARTRLRPFRSRGYRLYVAAIHTLWVTVRATALALHASPSAREGARALLRGHRAALAELLRQ
jgi:GT2 family glycosyltransferase